MHAQQVGGSGYTISRKVDEKGKWKMDPHFLSEVKSHNVCDDSVQVLKSEGILSKDTFKSLRKEHFTSLLPKMKIGSHAILLEWWEYLNQALYGSEVYGYMMPETNDHFYTNNEKEIGSVSPGVIGQHGAIPMGIAFRLFSKQESGTVPLHRYWNSKGCDHFYTTDENEIGTTELGAVGKHEYKYEGVLGYAYINSEQGTVPLFRFWNSAIVDHFYTTQTSFLEIVPPGYVYEGIQCYVIPGSTST